MPENRAGNMRYFTLVVTIACALIYISTTYVPQLSITSSPPHSKATHKTRILDETPSSTPDNVKCRSASRKRHPHPHVAQMLGFPRSGQNILQHAIHELTQTSTAVNYGQAVMNPDGMLFRSTHSGIPLYDDEEGENGPYAFSDAYPFPSSGYVLTRSYCAGHCLECWPKDYMKASVKRWLYECGVGSRFNVDTGRINQVYYNTTELVEKNIHLIRNPFTNIPARFEHEYLRWEASNQQHMMKKYPLDRGGFLSWCSDYDDNVEDGRRREIEESYYLDTKELRDLARKVPCHTDFFRYIQWHNYAFEAAKGEFKNKPMKIVFYEDVQDDPEVVIKDVIRYLNLEIVPGAQLAQIEGQMYDGDYMTWEDFAIVKRYFEILASRSTWLHLKKYF